MSRKAPHVTKKKQNKRAQKTRQRKQNKRKQNKKKSSAPVAHLTANGLRRLIRDVDLDACGLTAGFLEGLKELDSRLSNEFAGAWSMVAAPGYQQLLELRAELEEKMLTEERVDKFMRALEKLATARRAYGALVNGLEDDTFIDVLWREVFVCLKDGLEDEQLGLRAQLFLPDFAPASDMEPTDLGVLGASLGVDQDKLKDYQRQLMAHPALIRFAELYPHLVARAKYSALHPLLTKAERGATLAELQICWAKSVTETALGRRVSLLLGLESEQLLSVLAVLGSAMHANHPLDLSSWTELQTAPDSQEAVLALASNQLVATPDESVVLLRELDLAPELALRGDEVLSSAYLALDKPELLRANAQQALARVKEGSVPEGLDPMVPTIFFQRFLDWLSPECEAIDWRLATKDVDCQPHQSLEESVSYLRLGLESGFHFAWEAVIRDEQDLPLGPVQSNYLEGLPAQQGRLEYIDGMPRPALSWAQELRAIAERATVSEDSELFLDPESPGYWPALCATLRERAIELGNPGDLCDPVTALKPEHRFALDREICHQELEELGGADFFRCLLRLRASAIATDASLDDLLSGLEESLKTEMAGCLTAWLRLDSGSLASRLALYDMF